VCDTAKATHPPPSKKTAPAMIIHTFNGDAED
jgi:hypothetical protein